MIIASCGHEISLEWHNNEKSIIIYKDYDNGKHVCIGAVVCHECRKYYVRKRLILKTTEEEERWMRDESKK